MICPDCKSEIDDDADVCPSCGMFILDDERESEYAPRIFPVSSVVFGAMTIGVAVALLASGRSLPELWMFALVTAVVGLLLGIKGRKSEIPKVGTAGVMLNGTALVLGLLACFG